MGRMAAQRAGYVGGRTGPRLLAAILGMALIATACGGSDAAEDQPSAGTSDGTAQSRQDANSQSTTTFAISDDEGEFVVGATERPDWLPVWLLLPDGLITLAMAFTAASGDAFINGTVPDTSPEKLYTDAAFMVQSGGYVITEEFENEGRGFTADHTSDGSSLRFVVAATDDGFALWGMEFSGLTAAASNDVAARPAPGAGDIGLEPLERRGSLSITVVNPRVSSRIDGACDGTNSQVQFIGDDGLTRFVVFGGDVVGAAGEITAEVEGSELTWVAAADSETSTAQTTRTSAYYEGDFLVGGDVTFAVVQITCNE